MIPDIDTYKWQVLVVRPRSEKKVGRNLGVMGFETCVPTQLQYRQWNDRRKKVEVVLFHNYVFVATDTKRYNNVFLDGNVLKYLSFGGQRAILSAKDVAMIKQLSHLELPVQISYQSFQPHDEVEIISGSLAGQRGRIIFQNGCSRLQLELSGLHCFAQVELCNTEVRRLQS